MRVAFSSRTVPQGSQVTQFLAAGMFASLATLASLPVAVASVFFFCFARPPLIPQGENPKMFLMAKKFYKNILERQKSHPVVKPSDCTMCSYCCVLMYSSNCPRRVTRRRSASERVARKPLQSSIYASSLLSGEKKKSVPAATASGSFFCDLLQGSFKFFTNIIGIQRMCFVRFFTKQLSVLEV